MIQGDPKTGDLPFCGEILKFATAPFRSGRSLDGAIDDLIEQMKVKADEPRGDDPTTASNKAAIQIERDEAEDHRRQERAEVDAKLKASELLQKEFEHKKMELQNDRC